MANPLQQHGLKEAIASTRAQFIRTLETFTHFTRRCNKEFESISREVNSLNDRMIAIEALLGSSTQFDCQSTTHTHQPDSSTAPVPTNGPWTLVINLAETTPTGESRLQVGTSSGHGADDTSETIPPAPKKKKEPNWMFLDPCSFCDKDGHWSNSCPDYITYETRVSRIKERGLCGRCLKSPHSEDECQWTQKCRFCLSLDHNKLLCPINPDLRPSGVS